MSYVAVGMGVLSIDGGKFVVSKRRNVNEKEAKRSKAHGQRLKP